MVRYKVHLDATATITIEAAKVNYGVSRLWFFDGEDNLLAVFLWNNIHGFSVDGSAAGQVITDKIPLEMGTIAPEELSRSTRKQIEEREKLERGTD